MVLLSAITTLALLIFPKALLFLFLNAYTTQKTSEDACFSQLEPKPPSGGADKNIRSHFYSYVCHIAATNEL
jgi:hypothetical protein